MTTCRLAIVSAPVGKVTLGSVRCQPARSRVPRALSPLSAFGMMSPAPGAEEAARRRPFVHTLTTRRVTCDAEGDHSGRGAHRHRPVRRRPGGVLGRRPGDLPSQVPDRAQPGARRTGGRGDSGPGAPGRVGRERRARGGDPGRPACDRLRHGGQHGLRLGHEGARDGPPGHPARRGEHLPRRRHGEHEQCALLPQGDALGPQAGQHGDDRRRGRRGPALPGHRHDHGDDRRGDRLAHGHHPPGDGCLGPA